MSEGLNNFSNIFSASINYTNQIYGEYFRVFLQPSIGINSTHVDFFFTLRTSFVRVTKIETDLEADWNNQYVSDEDYEAYTEFLKRKKYNVFYEPTVTFRAGAKHIKGFIQLGASLNSIANVQTTFRQRPIIFVIGIHSDVNFLK